MTITTVILSDGQPCDVRQMGIFEPDEVRAEMIGPYTYEVETVDGRKFQAEYDGSRWSEKGGPPQKPNKPESEIEEDSEEWYALIEYLRYEAWLVHERKRNKLVNQYHLDLAHYILDNCITPEDKKRVVTPEDWSAIHKAAMVPELTLEALAETLQATFPGQL